MNIKSLSKLIAACILHLSIGSVYAWSTLVIPIEIETGWDKNYITFAFSLIILFLSIAAFTARKICNRFGLSLSCLLASALFGISYVMIGYSVYLQSLPLFYLFSMLAGLGVGICYILPVDMIMQWFPKKKGVSAGSCIMAFGFGSAIAAPCFNSLCDMYGPYATMVIMGITYAVLMGGASLLLSLPSRINEEGMTLSTVYYDRDKFIKLFLAFYINIGCGISLLSIASPIIQNLGATSAFAALAVSLIGIANGSGRIIWAAISDKLGRNRTYQILFALEAVLFILLAITDNPYLFTIIAFLIITAYGGGFAIMPAYVADGFKHFTKQNQEKSTVVAIHGKVLLAWGIAGITAPLVLSYTYQTIGPDIIFILFGFIFLVGYFLRRKYPALD